MASNGQSEGLNKSAPTTYQQALSEILGAEGVSGFPGPALTPYDYFGPEGGAFITPPEYWTNPPLNLLPKESFREELEGEFYGPGDGELFPDTFGNEDTLQDFLDQFVPEDGDVYEFNQDEEVPMDWYDEEYFEEDEIPIGPNQEKYGTNFSGGYSGMDQTGSDKDLTPGGVDPGAAMAKSGTYLDAENKKVETLTTEKDLTETPGPTGSYKNDLELIYGKPNAIEYHKGQQVRISNTSKKPADPNNSVVNKCKAKGFELNRFADGYYKNYVRSAVSGNPVRTASGGFVFTRGEKIPNYISGYTGE